MTKESDGGTNIQGNQQNISGQVNGPVVGGNVGQIGDNYYQQPQPYRAPLQRPARSDHFQDRKDELAQLLAALQPGAVITLSGPGGMGKSALAAEAVWHLAPADQPGDQPGDQSPTRFPDGIFFHSFYNQPAVDAACEQIARSFGLEAKGSPRENARLALAGRRALLILDGAEDADDLPSLLDMRDGCGVLITSRDRRIHAGRRTDLPPLPPADAIALIRAWAGEPDRSQAAADPTVADPAMAEIAELVGHLPMALRLVGSYLDESAETPAAYLAWLHRSPLAALDQGQRRMQSADILLARTVARLNDDERAVLAVAGLLAFAPVDAEIIAHALERALDDLRPAFAQLVRYSLLVRDGEGRYQTAHALVHTYARLRLTPPPQALERLAAHYDHLARDLSSQGQAGYRALDPHRPHLLALMSRCHDAQAWEILSSLVWAVDNYLDMQGYTSERVAVLGLGILAARVPGDRRDEGAHLGNLGSAYAALGQVTQAIEHYAEALVISREIGDQRDEGNRLGNLGVAYADLGQLEKAIVYYTQALGISREIGDRRGEEYQLGNLGNTYAGQGQVNQAIEHFTEALVISREIGDREGEGAHLGNLGSAYAALGQVTQAIEHYAEALVISREIGDRRNEGNWLGNLGVAYADLGQLEKAIVYYTQALGISREIGDRRGESSRLGNLGLAYAALGQVENAIEYYTQALIIHNGIGDRRGEGNQLNNLGNIYAALGQVEKAIEHYTDALVIQREIGNRRGEGNLMNNLGNVHRNMGQVEKAIGHYTQSLVISRDIGDRRGEGDCLANTGMAYKQLGDIDKARTLWQKVLAIYEEIQSPTAETVRAWLADLASSP